MALVNGTSAVLINPSAPTGLVPQRLDDQFEGVQ